MDIDGWKDGKFDPDSVEPDYEFAFGQGPEEEPDSIFLFGQEVQLPPEGLEENKEFVEAINNNMQPTPKIDANAIKKMKKIHLQILWKNVNMPNTELLLDENGGFIVKNGANELKIVAQDIKEK